MRRPPRRLCEGDLLPCWVWLGDKWRPGWAIKQLVKGPNKGDWWVLTRVHQQNRLGNWSFKWRRRKVKARWIKWIQ